jgi:hypothetical protein
MVIRTSCSLEQKAFAKSLPSPLHHFQGMLVETSTQKGNDMLGFEGLTVLVMKSTILWDIMPRNPLKEN